MLAVMLLPVIVPAGRVDSAVNHVACDRRFEHVKYRLAIFDHGADGDVVQRPCVPRLAAALRVEGRLVEDDGRPAFVLTPLDDAGVELEQIGSRQNSRSVRITDRMGPPGSARERGLDRLAELLRLGRDLAREERDDLAVFADEILAEVPVAARCPSRGEEGVDRRLAGAGLGDELREHRERHAVVLLAERLDLLGAAAAPGRRNRCSGSRAP